jgi:hypothetical protein
MAVKLVSSGGGSVTLDAASTSLLITQTIPAANGTLAIVTSSGTISDGIGNLRSIPVNTQTNTYTLIASDSGKFISITTGGLTVPTGIFSTGQAITIYNNSTSSQTITQGTSVTMYYVGTSSTGNRSLAQRGFCTIFCVDGGNNTFVISGGGLS